MSENAPPSLASGVYAALVTPRQRDASEADAGKMLDYIEHLERGGVAGMVLFGSTGEFVHFPPEERIRIAGLAIKRSRVPMLVNVSHSDFASVVALAEAGIHHGSAGLLIMPPYFYRYDGGAVEAFLQAIAALFSERISLYLYNLPQHTSPIPPDVAVRLLSSGRFAGIKDSSGDWAMFEALRQCRERHDFQLLVGHEKIYRRARIAGAQGTVSGVAGALPELITAFEAAIVSGNQQHMDDLEKKVTEYLGWLEKFPATFLIRQTAALRDWVPMNAGMPLSGTQQQDLERFREWFPDWHEELQASLQVLAQPPLSTSEA